jgi:Big-like domain-containing protein/hemolysin type calcium-binding protein
LEARLSGFVRSRRAERLGAFSDRDFGLYILRYTGPGAATAPVCEDALAFTRPNQPVTVPLRCSDPNSGNVLTRTIVRQPGNGTVAPQGDRAVYTPRTGFEGEDRFTFRASDGSLVSNVATVWILVAAQPGAAQPGAGRCVNLRLGIAASERLTGTRFGDTIVGYAGDDVINGLGGRDCISGKAGNDRLAGGKGGDTVDGQTGSDRITGGNACDTVRGGPGADRVSGGRAADLIQGDAGSDRLGGGSRRDLLRGGVGRDNIDGGRGRDSIEADAADRISARDGARDSIDCGRGRDTVVTRDRVDRLTSCEVRGRGGANVPPALPRPYGVPRRMPAHRAGIHRGIDRLRRGAAAAPGRGPPSRHARPRSRRR